MHYVVDKFHNSGRSTLKSKLAVLPMRIVYSQFQILAHSSGTGRLEVRAISAHRKIIYLK